MRLFKPLLSVVASAQMAACGPNTVQWKEEVVLNDGRTIVVTQKRRCEGGDVSAKTNATCIAKESWLTLKLPEISANDIVWHEGLVPMIVNIHQSRLYVVGFPAHLPEFRAYGATNPPYFGFAWADGTWKRIPFSEIPAAIYDRNMLLESIPRTRTDYMTVTRKNSPEENGDPRYPNFLKRVDPQFKMSAH